MTRAFRAADTGKPVTSRTANWAPFRACPADLAGVYGVLVADADGPARHRTPPKRTPAGKPHDHPLGRSRGEPTTKIHLEADGRHHPLAFQAGHGGTDFHRS